MILPPKGSRLKVDFDGRHQKIMIPHKSGDVLRWFIGCFYLFWLGAWLNGWIFAASVIFNPNSSSSVIFFHFFWLGGWTLGGAMVMWMLYRFFRPSVPETIILSDLGMSYDSGTAPLVFPYGMGESKAEFWEKMFPTRIRAVFNQNQIRTLKLREFDSGNRLTIDNGSQRIDIAAGASEPEREWLFDVLKRHYNF